MSMTVSSNDSLQQWHDDFNDNIDNVKLQQCFITLFISPVVWDNCLKQK